MRPGVGTGEAARFGCVCMPVLSPFAVAIAWLSVGRRCRIRYMTLPRYARGFCRITSLSQKRLEQWILACTRGAVARFPPVDVIDAYPSVNLRAMELVTRVAELLAAELSADPSVNSLSALAGTEPALAYALRHVSHVDLFPHVLVLTLAAHLEHGPLSLVVPARWPKSWSEAIRGVFTGVSFQRVPPALFQPFFAMWARLCLLGSLGRITARVLRSGISLAYAPARPVKLLAEFTHPDHFSGGTSDQDYWVDGHELRADEVVFFLTRDQEAYLGRTGWSREELKRLAASKGRALEVLSELPSSTPALRAIGKGWGEGARLLGRGSAATCQVFASGLRSYVQFAPLFARYTAKNMIYPTFPAGRSWSLDGPVITGLCRQHGVRSVAYQPHVVYCSRYEFWFECFDLYLAWGPAWHAALGAGARFLREVISVGCVYLDRQESQRRARATWPGSEQRPLTVAVFTADVGNPLLHYTAEYNLRLLRRCARYACGHPGVRFLIKCKDSEHADIFMADPELQRLRTTVPNFGFVRRRRHDYADVMDLAHIVIAIGFTSPGVEALLAGKRALYYSELKTSVDVLTRIPGLVANSLDELDELFDQAMRDYPRYAHSIAPYLDGLDPFRDGRTRDRVSAILADGSVPEAERAEEARPADEMREAESSIEAIGEVTGVGTHKGRA